MNITNNYKWENFESEFIPFVENNVTEIYAVSINENEASLITLEEESLVLNRFENDNGVVSSNKVDEFKFKNIKQCLQYLRLVKEDHANNYYYKDLVKKLISQLYMNNHVKSEDVIAQ